MIVKGEHFNLSDSKFCEYIKKEELTISTNGIYIVESEITSTGHSVTIQKKKRFSHSFFS